jgi:hypothetical protein
LFWPCLGTVFVDWLPDARVTMVVLLLLIFFAGAHNHCHQGERKIAVIVGL